MRKIGIISDTHGSLERWEMSWELLKDTDFIIHCGDVFNHGPGNPIPEGYCPKKLFEKLNNIEKPIFVVKGNCDSEVDQTFLSSPFISPYFFAVIENYRIIAIHGHLLNDNFFEKVKKWNINFLISGHTHIWKIEKKGNIILLNPGSPSLPKNESSCGIIDFQNRKVSILNILNKTILKEESF